MIATINENTVGMPFNRLWTAAMKSQWKNMKWIAIHNHLVVSFKLEPIWAGNNGNGYIFDFKIQFVRYRPTVTFNCVTF